MKLITAYIKPIKFNDVIYALHEEPGVHGASLSDGRGFGGWRESLSKDERESLEVDFTPHVRIEIACSDDHAEAIRRCIAHAAHTGRPGDGLILISDLNQAHRIGANAETRFIGTRSANDDDR